MACPLSFATASPIWRRSLAEQQTTPTFRVAVASLARNWDIERRYRLSRADTLAATRDYHEAAAEAQRAAHYGDAAASLQSLLDRYPNEDGLVP